MVWAMNDKALIDLEIKVSHLENLLETFNLTTTRQELQIYHLEAKVEALIKELRDNRTSDKHKTTRNEPPPHY